MQPNATPKPADRVQEESNAEKAEKNSTQNRSWVVVHRTETAVDMNDTQVQLEVVTIQKHMHNLTKYNHIIDWENFSF